MATQKNEIIGYRSYSRSSFESGRSLKERIKESERPTAPCRDADWWVDVCDLRRERVAPMLVALDHAAPAKPVSHVGDFVSE
jgi:hypothetical protein